jgi:hypothetical protein
MYFLGFSWCVMVLLTSLVFYSLYYKHQIGDRVFSFIIGKYSHFIFHLKYVM